MKCPACGQWNRDTDTRCLYCGTVLPAAHEEEPAWKSRIKDGDPGTRHYRMDEWGETDATDDARDQLAQEMADLKERKAKGAKKKQDFLAAAAARGSAPSAVDIHFSPGTDSFWRIQEDTGRPRAPRFQRQKGSRTTVRVAGEEPVEEEVRWDDSRSFDPLWAEQEAYASRWQQPAPRAPELPRLTSRQRFFRKLLRAVTWLLALSVAGLCVFFGYHYFQERSAAAREEKRATVIVSMLDDLAAHTIMIPGEEGAQIYIRELHTAYIVTGGYATIEVADHIWYDDIDQLRSESMEIVLTPFLKSAGGRQVPLEEIRYTIDIPLSPIELINPDGLRATVSSSMYSIKLNVRPGSKVTLNGVDVSDTVNGDSGDLSCNVTVQPNGDNEYVVICRSQYCRENEMRIVLYREPQEIPLDLAADTYTSTNQKYMEVNCTTLPGATIDVVSDHTDLNITNLDSTGAFSFIAEFNHIGDNDIEIVASYPGKKPSRVVYTVYYVPSVDIYTRRAWPLNNPDDYSELISNISIRAERTQVYVLTGTLQYFVSEKPQMAVFNTSADGQSQPVLVENYSKTTWKKGEFYTIYADAYSTYNGMPWLRGRYTK
jgi:hypothetical protein